MSEITYFIFILYATYIKHFLTDVITPWSRVLLEKLSGFQLVKKFPSFYVTRRFLTAVTGACYLFLS
jgi:hypothetical protein